MAAWLRENMPVIDENDEKSTSTDLDPYLIGLTLHSWNAVQP
jgi:hypothetical protein